MKWIGQNIYDYVSRFRNHVYINGSLYMGTSEILSDSSGTTTLKNIDALDATTISTFETAMESNLDTLNSVTSMTGLTTIGTAGVTTDIAAGDLTMYNAVNDGNPTISLGSSVNDRLLIEAEYNSGNQQLNEINFKTSTVSSTANDGRMVFHVDDVEVLIIRDSGINLKANMGVTIAGTDILTDSSGTATLSNIDALDATTKNTMLTGLAWFAIKGFSTGDGTNYEICTDLADDDAPWKHSTSSGSDGLTALSVSNIIRSGGLVMPRAGTMKKWFGWAATGGSSTVDIALFKITPTRNDSSTVAPVLIDNISYTALGNTKMEDFNETTFTDGDLAAGDIIISGIKCQSSKTTFFSSTIEIAWD